MSGQRIGELNGQWAFLLKMVLAAFPVITSLGVAFAIWLTSEAYANKAFRESAHFSREDAAALHYRMMQEVHRVESRGDAQNAQVLVVLEQIKTRIDNSNRVAKP